MRLDPRWSRAVLTTVAVAVVAASFAPTASADRERRYKGAPWGPPRHVVVAPAPRVVWVSGHSSAAPAFAGFVGGLILGSAFAHATVVAAPPPPAYCPPPPEYDFVDPYCHERFESLDAYAEHLDYERHPAVALVIDERTGRCVGEQVWHDGRWCERDAPRDWDDEDGDR